MGLSMIEIAILVVLAVAIVKLAQSAIEYVFPHRDSEAPDIAL
jgi:hypothetical protein